MFYDSKHVLVTGGTGFVGTHIVQELLKYKAQIRIPIHKRQPLVTGKHIETIEADLTSHEDCLRAVCDSVNIGYGKVKSLLRSNCKTV